LIKFIGQEGEPVGKPTSIKWYGPTMGKTTATKIHDELVDIDPLLKPIRQKYANILGLDIRDPKVSQHPEYK
jgi:ABC-type Zn2+ transport system substrate-binding protein/surface adhesin